MNSSSVQSTTITAGSPVLSAGDLHPCILAFLHAHPEFTGDIKKNEFLKCVLEQTCFNETSKDQYLRIDLALSAYYGTDLHPTREKIVFSNGMTLTHFAALGGQESCFVKEDSKDMNGAYGAHYLAMGGRNIDLLNRVDEASLFIRDDYGYSPLDYAFIYQRKEVVEWFAQNKNSSLACLMRDTMLSLYADDSRLYTELGIKTLLLFDKMSCYEQLGGTSNALDGVLILFVYVYEAFRRFFSASNERLVSMHEILVRYSFKGSEEERALLISLADRVRNTIQAKIDLLDKKALSQERASCERKAAFVLDLILRSSSDYTKREKLGKGSFGSVCMVHDSKNRFYALKSFFRSVSSKDRTENQWYNYLAAVDSEHKEHLVRKIDFVFFDNKPTLVLEPYECNLHFFICFYGDDPAYSGWITNIARQILGAIAFLHQHKIVHTDVKLDNILFRPPFYFAVGDFDSAYRETLPPPSHSLQTSWYRSPECELHAIKYYGPKMDVWSFGCTLFELIHKRPLFSFEENQIMQKQHEYLGEYPSTLVEQASEARRQEYQAIHIPGSTSILTQMLGQVSKSLVDLLKKTLELDPVQRISAAEALIHPFFTPLGESKKRTVSDIGSVTASKKKR